MPCLEFTHRIACRAQQLERAAQAVLHTIFFHRLLGTVKPAYVDAYGMTFPAIADAQVDQLIQQRAAQLVALASTSKTITLVVYFLHPSSRIAGAIQPGNKPTLANDPIRTASGASDKPSMVHTATHAASSLRAWASPRNYQYGWLAHAFSSGAGQPSGPFVNPSSDARDHVVQAELSDLEADAFERWSITFELNSGDKQTEGIKRQLATFVQHVLEFAGENKAHLPASASADLCPYPMQVVARAGG